MSKLRFYLPVLGFFFVAIALWRGLYLDTKTLPSMLIDKPMPNFELTSVDGIDVSNSDLPDQIFLLNVWGSYCLPCLIEHPTLMRLSEEGAIPVVGVNYRDRQGLAIDWLADNGNPSKPQCPSSSSISHRVAMQFVAAQHKLFAGRYIRIRYR